MKLNTKFSLIVALTVFFIAVLTFCTQMWSRRNMRIKEYQYQQLFVQKELSDLINYINQVDYHQIMAASAGRDYAQKFDAVNDSMEYLVKNPLIKTFPKEFQETLVQLEQLWNVNKARYEKLTPWMEKIQETDLPLSMYTQVQKSGIRDSYSRYPENEMIQDLYEYVQNIDGEFSGILAGYQTLTKITNQSSYQFESIVDSANRKYAIYAVIMALIISVLLAVSISTITFKIAGRIMTVRDMSKGLAKKDFTVSIKPNGSGEMQDLMQNMNNMVNELNDFLLVVKKTASKAISSGYQINDSANSTAAATTEIDANIESITKEFDQISQSVERSVQIIKEMDRQVQNLVHYNERQTQAISNSNETVIQVAETLEEITQMAEERTRSAQEMHQLVADGDAKISLTAKKLDEIKTQLNQIGGIVKIINDIASQTNLLSMNAAIESAHAGEAGQGFAVVAAEIRGLAENTSVNAKRIKESINQIVGTVAGANIASAEASEAFGKVRVNVDAVVQSMQDISGSIVKIDESMKSIKAKTEETAQAANEINGYGNRLVEKQQDVTNEVTSMNNMFIQVQNGIHEIKRGTTDIVYRITEVSDNSKDSYKNMTDLENILEEFKTQGAVDDAIAQEDDQNAIQNIKAEELAAQAMSMAEEVFISADGKEEIEFNPEDVEEI